MGTQWRPVDDDNPTPRGGRQPLGSGFGSSSAAEDACIHRATSTSAGGLFGVVVADVNLVTRLSRS
jgi:hypothetical protein